MGSDAALKEALLTDTESGDAQHRNSGAPCDGEAGMNAGDDSIKFGTSDVGKEFGSDVLIEIKITSKLAWPLILFNVVFFSIPVATLMFVGHLGELELSSASIASSFGMVTAFTVMLGLASTLETLCGQAYGAKNYRMLGVYLQSSYIVCTGAAFLILALWMNVAAILKAMGQDPEIARLAERYLMYMSPGVFGAGILRPTVKFLQSQSVVMPVLLCSFVAFAFHIPCCYIMIHVLEFGFIGGAVSNAITYQFLTVLVFLYSWLSGSCKHTLTGFTWEAFSYLDVYLKLAIPSTFMLCLSTTNLASMIPNGLSGAAGTRVANELGAYRPQAAKLAGKVIMTISVVSTCIVAGCILVFRDVWGKAFSNVDEVLQSVRHLTPLIALAAFMDGIQGVLSGIARGCGRQDMGAFINLTAYYIFGIPSGFYLGFSRGIGAEGLWIGLLIGDLVQTVLLATLVLTTNWDKMADDAVRRVACKTALPEYVEDQQSLVVEQHH
ncbi:hypothetical protein AXG93_2278s1570 [Marchantia polymorpha subsp. ruderalis]|uniref:Protein DETOXIFICATION n=1 Tax=Marchantia polymorpha subsp. ruderalis TaxID=1480154 RepID=A0A176WG28_MARPO|nr:hypothetical protein AXG93_2278s1570 [Marchantia polymorpha subsp. ruderalis]